MIFECKYIKVEFCSPLQAKVFGKIKCMNSRSVVGSIIGHFTFSLFYSSIHNIKNDTHLRSRTQQARGMQATSHSLRRVMRGDQTETPTQCLCRYHVSVRTGRISSPRNMSQTTCLGISVGTKSIFL